VLDDDRLFPVEPSVRALARELYEGIRGLPILSPHGHTDPRWYAENQPFPDPAQLFVTPDHYVFRMLFSQGIPLERLGVPGADGRAAETDGRAIWRLWLRHDPSVGVLLPREARGVGVSVRPARASRAGAVRAPTRSGSRGSARPGAGCARPRVHARCRDRS